MRRPVRLGPLFGFTAIIKIVGRFAVIEVDFQLANAQRRRSIFGFKFVPKAVNASDLITAIVHFDALNRPASLLKLLSQHFARLPGGYRIETIAISQCRAADKGARQCGTCEE